MLKSSKWFAITAVALLIFTADFSSAQDGNIVFVQTWQFQMPEDGSWTEFDSLSTVVNEKVVKKNSKILSQRVLRHLWGSDSRQLIVIQEYAKIEDLVLDDDLDRELFMAAWKTDEERRAFNQAYGKYWGGYHSDEIYQEFSGARK